MNSCGPNDVRQWGYSLDWDGRVPVCSYSRRPNDGFQGCGQFRQRPHTDKTDSCGPNDGFQRGYPLDWDGPVSLGSVNSGPVSTGRPTVLGLVYHEIEILVVNGTNSAGNLWI